MEAGEELGFGGDEKGRNGLSPSWRLKRGVGFFWCFAFFFFNLFIIYFWLHWVFVAVLSLVAASGGHSSPRCAVFSMRWPLLLRNTGSRCMGFSSRGTRAQ